MHRIGRRVKYVTTSGRCYLRGGLRVAEERVGGGYFRHADEVHVGKCLLTTQTYSKGGRRGGKGKRGTSDACTGIILR